MRLRSIAALLLTLTFTTASFATPPDMVNYQGVLRDASGTPLHGSFDMTFRFFNSETAGDEILVDRHLASAGLGVVVTNGMFNVMLGSGEVLDGSGSGVFTSLADVFSAYPGVHLEIQVDSETLSPRTRILSSGYALNAKYVDGRSASEFLDTSTNTQFKPGKLVTGGLSSQPLDYGIEGYGASGGGYFENEISGCSARLGLQLNGIRAECGTEPAVFSNTTSTEWASFATGTYGINANGTVAGGLFRDINGSGLAEIAKTDWGILAEGNGFGGRFTDLDDGGAAWLGLGSEGILAQGSTRGGRFLDTDGSGFAYLAQGDDGVHGYGNANGGYFEDLDGTGYAEVGTGDTGIKGYGNSSGGQFSDLDGSGVAYVGKGDEGINAFGNSSGGYFSDLDSSGFAYIASGDNGILAYGSIQGGYFKDDDDSGYARVGYGDYGIQAFGDIAGARFEDLTSSGFVLLANGDSGILAYGNTQGGYFNDLDSSSYGRVGYSIYKIFGSGTVSFAQNHPEEPDKVVVYHAPESSEVSVYTRGSAVLENGLARIALDETFQWVANPDLGLTAHLTPRGVAEPLAVVSVSTTELIVRGPAGSTAAFDYMVWGLRIGFEEAAPVQKKEQESYIPSMREHREMYAQDASLRRYNSFERFREIESRVRGVDRESLDLSRANALMARIGEYDRDLHGEADLKPMPVEKGTSDAEPGRPASPQRRQNAPIAITGVSSTRQPVDASTERAVEADETLWLPVTTAVETGDVLALSVASPGMLERAGSMADPQVVGIAAGPSRQSADGDLEVPMAEERYPMVNVDAGFGSIQPGDLLVASPTAGHAMRAIGAVPGTIIGKAIDALGTGTGTIRVLLMAR